MFTGIINSTTKVTTVKKQTDGMFLALQKPKAWKVKVGDSININGVCSTVKKSGSILEFEYMPETLTKTNLSRLTAGNLVNLEQSLRVADRLDGHIVQGHIDIAGTLSAITTEGNSYILEIKVPNTSLLRLAAPKGSVALEGISLTVIDVSSKSFTVKIIPYTWQHTNLHSRRVGDNVNVEFDVLAKYVRQLIKIK